MIDRETESLWSQITGEAFQGDLTGTQLKVYPSEMVTWSEWLSAHPDTRVLFKEEDARKEGSPYVGYFEDAEKQGMFGRQVEDDRLQPKTVVIAVELEGNALVFPRDELPATGVIHAEVGDAPVILVRNVTGGAAAFRADPAGKTLRFRLEGDELVTEGDSAPGPWNSLTGQPLAGGTALVPLRAQTVFWFGWVSFFPESKLWSSE